MFWTLAHDGTEVLRDLKNENETFSIEKYVNGEFDANNFQWYEMFHHFVYDDLGCDYERYGCYIREGDVVLDLGGNIGVFAHRAETRGASKVISFEPVTPTFNCLIKNRGPKTLVYKNAVGGKHGFTTFKIHTDYTHIGGGTSDDQDLFEIIKHTDHPADYKMTRSQTHKNIQELVDLLPEEQREIIVLRHYANLSFKEIAQMTNCSINTALGRMRYGLINLRKMMAERGMSL